MIFNWDINNSAQQDMPPQLQKPKHFSWLKALLFPILSLKETFIQYRLDTLKKMHYNGQVIVLENLLNDLYDATLRRIRIVTTYDLLAPPYLLQQNENQPLYVFTQAEYTANPLMPKVYLHNESELNSLYDFIVEAAAGSLTAIQIVRLKGTVNYYRLAGTKPYYRYNNLIPF